MDEYGRFHMMTDELTDRIHEDLEDINRQPIGWGDTPMWETGEAKRILQIEEKGMRVVEYWEEIEEFMTDVYPIGRRRIIYDLSDKEKDRFAYHLQQILSGK